MRKILVSEATASGRSARKQRLRLGTEITHCRTAPAGSRDRLWCAAVCTMRRPLHDGQTPLPSLHENATTNPSQPLHLGPRKPEAEDAAFQILTQFLLHLCWDARLLEQPPLEPTLQKITDGVVKRRAFRPPPLVAGDVLPIY